MSNNPMTSFAAVVRCMYYCLVTPGCLPPLAWGAPGEAKTSVMNALAQRLDLPMETLIASICDPTDIGGALWPDGDRVKRLPMEWAMRLIEQGGGILFLDEVSTAPPAVQAALLRLVLEGVAGDTKLTNVRFAAAANPPEQAAGGHEQSDSMANRFVHLTWPGPDVSEWSEYMLSGATVVDNLPTFDQQAWDRQLPLSRALIAAFLSKRAPLFRESPDKARGRFPMAIATPRTWDAAARLHATLTVFGDNDNKTRLLGGCVGEGAATELVSYERKSDLPDVEALLKKPDSWTPDPKRPDRTFAVVLMVAAAATQQQFKKGPGGDPVADTKLYSERWESAWRVMGRTMEEGKDLVVVGARMLAKARPQGNSAMLKPEVQSIIAELVGVVRESGLMAS